MGFPHTFANLPGPVPLSYLDDNFNSFANATDPTQGAGAISFTPGAAYAAGSIGYQENLAQLRQGYADFLAKFVAAMYNGSAATLQCYGDSTMWGADPANLSMQVALPPPAALQVMLRNYYGNTAATCNNLGISGTTLNQMILGTDGSGSTFQAKMASSGGSQIVYCNHCINDANAPGLQTTADVYKSNLTLFVQLCRFYGNFPIIVEGFLELPYGTFGTRSRAETMKIFVGVQRAVAMQYGVPLVQNYAFIQRMLQSGKYKPLDLLPDGVHATAALYKQMGQNLGIPLVGGVQGFTAPDQFRSLADGGVIATNETSQADLASRTGFSIVTGTTATEQLKILVLIEQPKLDIYMAGVIFASGASNFPITVDGVTIASNFSQFAANFTAGAGFIHDHEICVIENADPGLHYIDLIPNTLTFAAALNYFRSRQAFWSNPFIRQAGSTTSQENYSRLLTPQLDMFAAGTNSITLFTDFPTPRLLRTFQLNFTSQIPINSGVILHGSSVGTNAGPVAAIGGITVGLNASGFLTVFEQTGPSSQITSVLGAVNLSAASHAYVIQCTAGGVFGSLTVFVDGSSIGTYNYTLPWFGGFLGMFKAAAGGVFTITNVNEVMRL